jgi:hypothetical protein
MPYLSELADALDDAFQALGARLRGFDEPRPHIRHSSLYLPDPVYEALRETAFKERRKIHDLVMEGIGLALRKRGYPVLDDLKAGKN